MVHNGASLGRSHTSIKLQQDESLHQHRAFGKNVLQCRNLPLCLHSSRAAVTDRHSWWFPAVARAGRLLRVDKVHGIALPRSPVWPVSCLHSCWQRL